MTQPVDTLALAGAMAAIVRAAEAMEDAGDLNPEGPRHDMSASIRRDELHRAIWRARITRGQATRDETEAKNAPKAPREETER